MKKILITGVAGFIGFHLCKKLISDGFCVIGVDNLNDYYSVKLKRDRLSLLPVKNFTFYNVDLCNYEGLSSLFAEHNFDAVINLAAQAGVRYSIENPDAYINSNILGFHNILSASQKANVKHFLYASSSSVYGLNQKVPFSEEDKTESPASLYAATKKSNELIAHSYSNIYKMQTTGFRFFTVYGPWGRPDMAYYSFVNDILSGRPISLFNNGEMERDFTFIDDVVEAVSRFFYDDIFEKLSFYRDSESNKALKYHNIFNVGNNTPVTLTDFVKTIESRLGKPAKIISKPMQLGDVKMTFADTSLINDIIDYKPSTTLSSGIDKFISWYESYYSEVNS